MRGDRLDPAGFLGIPIWCFVGWSVVYSGQNCAFLFEDSLHQFLILYFNFLLLFPAVPIMQTLSPIFLFFSLHTLPILCFTHQTIYSISAWFNMLIRVYLGHFGIDLFILLLEYLQMLMIFPVETMSLVMLMHLVDTVVMVGVLGNRGSFSIINVLDCPKMLDIHLFPHFIFDWVAH